MSDGRRLLIDNDVFILLAGSGLLSEALTAIGFTDADVRRLDTLPHVLRKSRSIAAAYPAEVRQAAEEACYRYEPLCDAPSLATVAAFSAVASIDPGEAVLFGVGAERATWFLTTGDKRALTAFGSAPELGGYAQQIAGRIIAFEALLTVLVERKGAAVVATAFGPLTKSHKTLSIVFSDANRGNDAECLAAIGSYLRDLRARPGVARLLRD